MDQERAFLHDISSPVTTIQLNVENAICILEDGNRGSVDDCLKILRASLAQTARVSSMIRDRRTELQKEAKE